MTLTFSTPPFNTTTATVGMTYGVANTVTVTTDDLEIVDFGFGLTFWRNKRTGYLRGPVKVHGSLKAAT